MAKKLSDPISATVSKLSDTINRLTNYVGDLIGRQAREALSPGGAIGKGLEASAAPVFNISNLLEPLNNVLGKLASKLGGAFGPILLAVEKVNPASAQQFNLALHDMFAVLGQMLIPVLNAGTQLIRKLADVFNAMKPALDPIINTLVKMIKLFAELIQPIATLLVPLLRIVAYTLENVLIPVLEKLVGIIKWVARQIINVINMLIDSVNNLPGVNISKIPQIDEELESTKGTGIRSTSMMGASQLGAATRQAALGQSYNERMEQNVKAAVGLLGQIAEATKNGAAAQKDKADAARKQQGQMEVGAGDF